VVVRGCEVVLLAGPGGAGIGGEMSDGGVSQRGVEERTGKRNVQLALQAIGNYNIGQRWAQLARVPAGSREAVLRIR